MGMCSIDYGPETPIVERLDWRPLSIIGAVTSTTIIEAIPGYVNAITSPIGTLENLSPDGYYMRADPYDVGIRLRNPKGPILVPDEIRIEQQFIDHNKESMKKTNYHALEAQVALHMCLRIKFPDAHIAIAGASARKGGDKEKKERARQVGFNMMAQYAPAWNAYLMLLLDPQHTCDAVTMTVDERKFQGMPKLIDAVIKWEREQPIAPPKAAKTRGARGRFSRGRGKA